MATGLGALAVAGLGTAFLCVALLVLQRMDRDDSRLMQIEVVAEGRHFPSKEIEEVFARNQIVFEPREISQSDDVTVKYHTWLERQAPVEDLLVQIRNIKGVTEVGWEPPKRI
jgi:uncharacterized membrane protein YhiD involved in acid resistance